LPFPADNPPAHQPEQAMSMATDEPDQGVMLFGNDGAWIWHAGSWHRPAATLEVPASRTGAVLVPLGNGSVLLSGGQRFPDFLTDTWIYGRTGA
jgi:hypothetical protein